MTVLLDTQVFLIASLEGLDALPKRARAVLADPNTEKVMSSTSIMELALKHAKGKIHIPEEKTSQAVQDMLITVIPFTPRHAYRLYSLPVHHGDPFDRMIVSTALVENVPIVGGDRQFISYKGLTVIWR